MPSLCPRPSPRSRNEITGVINKDASRCRSLFGPGNAASAVIGTHRLLIAQFLSVSVLCSLGRTVFYKRTRLCAVFFFNSLSGLPRRVEDSSSLREDNVIARCLRRNFSGTNCSRSVFGVESCGGVVVRNWGDLYATEKLLQLIRGANSRGQRFRG